MTNSQRISLLDLLRVATLYALAILLGGAVFIALLFMPTIAGIGILFYRGVASLVATGALLLMLSMLAARYGPACWRLRPSDMVGAIFGAVSLLFAGFILGPVTVDRSISIFLLSQIEASDTGLSSAELQHAFLDLYVGQWDQIGRRLEEQRISGTIVPTPQGWRLTAQGRDVMSTARLTSKLFGGDPRFVGRSK